MRKSRITDEYPWIEYDKEKGYVRCTICNVKMKIKKFIVRRHTQRFHVELLQNCDTNVKNDKELSFEKLPSSSISNNHNDEKNMVYFLNGENTDNVDSSDNNFNAGDLSDVIPKVNFENNNTKNLKGTTNKKSYLIKASYQKSSEEFGPYIKSSETDETKVSCCACKYDIVYVPAVIKSHLLSQRHLLNTNEIEKPAFDKENADREIRFAAKAVAGDDSFLSSENWFVFMKNMFTDSDMLGKMNLDRKKITAIVQSIIAPAHKQRLTGILKNVQFSISIDESTDITVHSSICIMVRYPDDERKKECDSLWDIVPAYRKGSEDGKVDAQYIFDAVIKTFQEADIPLENITAFCSDTCNLMMGRCNSVSSRFLQLNPDIAIVKCACHIEHLVAREAVGVFPPECLEMNNLIYNYISSSSKRMNRWLTLQFDLDEKELIVLKPVATRWLSCHATVKRILRRWTLLTTFFENEVLEAAANESQSNTDKSAEIIFRHLQDPLMYATFAFLESALSKLTKVNEHLQSEKPILNNKMTELYLYFLKMYMKEDYIGTMDISDIDPTDQSHFKLLNEINIGLGAEHFERLKYLEASNSQNDSDDEDWDTSFRVTCQSFYIECCKAIKKRCNFKETRLAFVPSNAMNKDYHYQHLSLVETFREFPQIRGTQNIDAQRTINEEWYNLSIYEFPETVVSAIKNAIYADDFWYILKQVCDVNGTLLFANLATFALTVLSIPHSNASSERIWSKLNNEKTKKRNRLSFSTIRAILLTAQCVHDQGGIMTFRATDYMIERMEVLKRCRGRNKLTNPVNDTDNEYYGNIRLSESLKRKCAVDEMLYFGKYPKNYGDNSMNLYLLCQNGDNELSIDNANEFDQPIKKQKIIQESITSQCSTLLDIQLENQMTMISTPKEIISDNVLNNSTSKLIPSNEMTLSQNGNNEALQYSVPKTIVNSEHNVKEVLASSRLIMENGLLSDFKYYSSSNDFRTIGRYAGKDNHPIRDYRTVDAHLKKPTIFRPGHETQLFAEEFKTLSGVKWIGGDVINAFAAAKEKEWSTTIAVATQHAKYALVTIGERDVNFNWFMFHLKGEFKGRIFMPYESNNHWCLFIIDVDKNRLTHIDPLKREKKQRKDRRSMICTKNFMKYLDMSKQFTSNNLQTIKWIYEAHADDKRPLQRDGFNCGVFVMYYMDCIANDHEFDPKFDANEYRQQVSKLLIYKSEPMQDVCLYCFRKMPNNLRITCRVCQRYVHWSCSEKEKLCVDKFSDLLSFQCELCSME